MRLRPSRMSAQATTTTFPALTGDGANYAVDVVFTPSLPPGPVNLVTATAGPGSATVNFNAPVTGGVASRYIVTPFIGATAQPAITVTGSPPSCWTKSTERSRNS